MTFEEFQATRQDFLNLAHCESVAAYGVEGPGHVYVDALFLQREPDGFYAAPIVDQLVRDRRREVVERALYAFMLDSSEP